MYLNKYDEMYLLMACIDINNGDLESAKENLLLAEENFDDSEYAMKKVYTSIFLKDIYLEEEDEEKAIEEAENAFNYINPKWYGKQYEVVLNMTRNLRDIEGGIDYIINSIEYMFEYDDELSLVAKSELNYRLKMCYLINHNYAKLCESLYMVAYYSVQLEDNYEYATALVELAIEMKQGDSYEYNINMLNSALEVEIEDEVEDATLKVYAYLNLGEYYTIEGQYDKAQEVINKVEEYKSYFDEETYRDMEIIININKANLSTAQGNYDEAESYLDVAKELIEIDEIIYFGDKDLYYLKAYGSLALAKYEYVDAIEAFDELLELSIERDYTVNQRYAAEKLYEISKELNNLDLINKYYDQLLEVRDREEELTYSEYSYYISDNVQKNITIKESEESKKVQRVLIGVSIVILILVFRIIYIYLKKLSESNEIDGLTNVYNRKCFNKEYHSMSKEKDYAVMILDIDNFKSINDTYGHQFGDEVLINVAKAIKDKLSDEAKVYRYGGEEFVVLKNHFSSTHHVVEVGELIRDTVEKLTWRENLKVTTSIGIAFNKYDDHNVLERADKNLYKAKKTGKNKVVY